MNNNTNTTRRIRLNCNFNLLRTSLQGALDAMDTLLYAQQGNVETPAYIKKAVDMNEDKEQVILNAEQDLFDNMDAADSLAEKVLRRFIEGGSEQQPAFQKPVFEETFGTITDGPSREWTAKVYLFDTPVEEFDDSKFFCKMAQRQDDNLGIKFDKGEMMFRVVFWSPEDEDKDKSWQDHQLPLDLQQALGLDMEEAHFASGFLPYSIINKLNRSDAVVWEAKPGVRIRLVKSEKQGAHLDGTFEDTLNSLLAYRKQQQEQAEA